VSGTGKQRVAENYNNKVFREMQSNNKMFIQVLDEMAKKILPTLTTNT
jgi:nitrogen regulatory protein PII